MVSQQNSNVAQRALWLTLKGAGVKEHSSEKFGDEVENPDKEQNRQELLTHPMRVQIAGLPGTVIISLSE